VTAVITCELLWISGYGLQPSVKISTTVIAKLQTSDAVENLSSAIASGAVHRTGKVPFWLR